MASSKKLVFFGNEKLATGVSADRNLRDSLSSAGYEIVAEVSGEIPAQLAESGSEAAVLAAFGQIIPKNVLAVFPRGIINLHPSLLPLYRGPSPIEQAILDDAKETGVSLMRLTPKLDAGPVLAQTKIKLSGHESKQHLADKLLDLGAELLQKELPKILAGDKKGTSQNDETATYTKLIKKTAGEVDFAKSAQRLEREVRAYAGWPRNQAKIFGRDVIITKARIAKDQSDGDLIIKCGEGYLEIEELIAPSGRTITGSQFLRGYAKSS